MEQFNKNFLTFLTISLFSLIAIQTGLSIYNRTSDILGLQDVGRTVPPPSTTCKTGVNSFSVSTSCGIGKFRYVTFRCYDNSSFKEGGPSSCKTSAQWKSYAAAKCAGKSNCAPKPSKIPTPAARRPTPATEEKTIPCYQLSEIYKQTCPIDSDTVHPACGKINSLLSVYCKSSGVVNPGTSFPVPPTTPIITTITPPLIEKGAFSLSLSNNTREITCRLSDPSCYFQTTVRGVNRTEKTFQYTTLWTTGKNISYTYNNSTISDNSRSTSDKSIEPGQEAFYTTVKVTPPNQVGTFYSYFYADGKSCNNQTTPPDCYYYGGSSFYVKITVTN